MNVAERCFQTKSEIRIRRQCIPQSRCGFGIKSKRIIRGRALGVLELIERQWPNDSAVKTTLPLAS